MEIPLFTILAILASVAGVSLVSLVGIILIPLRDRTLQAVLLSLVSFSAGALLGDAFLHLLPEAADAAFSLPLSLAILSGIILSFVTEKFIHWHHHGSRPDEHHIKPFAVMNLLGDGIHNFIDGLIIGASYLVSFPLGLATTIAVVFHEIPQEVGDFGVLLRGGFSRRQALWLNFLTALLAVFGALAATAFSNITGTLPLLLGFAAGTFVYIASADLIPELHKERAGAKSVAQVIALLCGIGVMLALLALE